MSFRKSNCHREDNRHQKSKIGNEAPDSRDSNMIKSSQKHNSKIKRHIIYQKCACVLARGEGGAWWSECVVLHNIQLYYKTK